MTTFICLLLITVVVQSRGDHVDSKQPPKRLDNTNSSSSNIDQLRAFGQSDTDTVRRFTCSETKITHPYTASTIYIGDKFGGFDPMLQAGSKMFVPCTMRVDTISVSAEAITSACFGADACETFYETKLPLWGTVKITWKSTKNSTAESNPGKTYTINPVNKLCDHDTCRSECLESDYCIVNLSTGKPACPETDFCKVILSGKESFNHYFKTCPANLDTVCKAANESKPVYSYYGNRTCEQSETNVVRLQYKGGNIRFGESVPIYDDGILVDVICTSDSFFNQATGMCYLRDVNLIINIERKVVCNERFPLRFDRSSIPDGSLELGLRCELIMAESRAYLSANFLIFNMSVSIDTHPNQSTAEATSYKCKTEGNVSLPFYIKQYQWKLNGNQLAEARDVLYTSETGVIHCAVLLAVASCGSGLAFRAERLYTSGTYVSAINLILICGVIGGVLVLLIVIGASVFFILRRNRKNHSGHKSLNNEGSDEELDAMLLRLIESRRETMLKEAASRPAKTREQMVAEYRQMMAEYKKNKKTK